MAIFNAKPPSRKVLKVIQLNDLIALLRFVFNPADIAAWGRIAILLPKVGDKGAQKLHGLALDIAKAKKMDFLDALDAPEVFAKVPPDCKEEWPRFTASLQQVGETMRTLSPANTIDVAIDGWYGDYLKGAFNNYPTRLDDLKSMVGFAGRFNEMSEMLGQVMLLSTETTSRSDDPNDDALRLTTVHQAKGLEFPIVFLVGLAENMFPLRRSIESGDIEEERRLFYVAVTRAKDQLYLCYPKVNTKGGPAMLMTASRFIEELSPDLHQPLRLKRSYGW